MGSASVAHHIYCDALSISFAIWHQFCDNILRRKPENISGGHNMELIRRFVSEEEGQGLVEYALIIGLIAIVAIVALTASGSSISGIFDNITGELEKAGGAAAGT